MEKQSKLKNFLLNLKWRFLRNDEAFGVVVIRTDCVPSLVLMTENYEGYWGFPKGHKEGNETYIQAATRELFEETGLECAVLLEPIFQAKRIFENHGRRLHKTNYFFIGLINHEMKVTLQISEIKDYKWATFDEAEKLLDTKSYPALKICFAEIRAYLESKSL